MAGSVDGERLEFWVPADGSEEEQLLRRLEPVLREGLRAHGFPEGVGIYVEEIDGGIQLVADRAELLRWVAALEAQERERLT
jgi:hypothetical protein